MSAPIAVADLRDVERRNLQVVAVGPTDCGKSRLLRELFVRRTPRVLTIDVNREARQQSPDAIVTYGWRELLEALERLATSPKWHVAAVLEEERRADLFRLLLPEIISPDSVSYPLAIGGLAIDCGEAYELAPSGRTSRWVKAAFVRGRHELVSSYVATQKLALCDLCVSDQAHVLVFFRTFGARELARIAEMLSRPFAERVKRLEQYHSLYVVKATGRAYHLDPRYRVLEVLDVEGNPVDV